MVEHFNIPIRIPQSLVYNRSKEHCQLNHSETSLVYVVVAGERYILSSSSCETITKRDHVLYHKIQ